jgi:hypothetical protein
MKKYIKFLTGLNTYLKNRMTPEEAVLEAKQQIRKRMENRNECFIQIVKKGIFENHNSPSNKLLTNVKIRIEDIKKWVEKNSVEYTLKMLLEDGVYFTVDEFKGKQEVIRKGLKFYCRESDFDNPYVKEAYEVRSGASRSAGTRVRIDFDFLTKKSLYDAYLLGMFDLLYSPIANWFPLFPGAPGINSSLRFSKIGNPPKKWFSQVKSSHVKVGWEKELGAKIIFSFARIYGVPIANPEFVDLNNAYIIAKWAETMCREFSKCVIYTFAASAVRVCLAAKEKNYSIKGTHFLVTGEPLTEKKKNEIENAGARAIPVYGISEAGVVAAGCNCSECGMESDHCHVYKDSTALIMHKYLDQKRELSVDSFLFSNLLFESPKLLLNVGMGDYGTVVEKTTDCEFGKVGFSTHVSNIRSYEKLTGEGVTFVDTDFMNIIEKVLPEKFGGSSTDYQLIESEQIGGLNKLKLLVSPKVSIIDENTLKATFINYLKNSKSSPESWTQSGTAMWEQVNMVMVERREPVQTKSGKIIPFYIEK